MLWRIDHKKLPANSYLFGTMHVHDQRAFKLMTQVYPKIDECAAFAVEFNVDEMAMNLDPNAMKLPANSSLDNLMKPKVYKKLKKIFRKTVGLNLDHFKDTKPLIVANLINEQILSKDMPTSLDMHLWNYAKQQDKITLGIETYQEQIDILKNIPLDYQLKALVGMGKNFKKHRKSLLKMTEQYERADIRQLYKSGLKSIGEIKKLLLFDRNLLMAERFSLFIQEQSLFAAVGAGHLAGKKGMLRLLKQKGFKVKPVYLQMN